MRSHEISNKRADAFVSCRVGLELKSYQEDLSTVLEVNNINDHANFIITPIAPPESLYHDTDKEDHHELTFIPDLVIADDVWEKQVAVSLGQPSLYSHDNSHAITIFDKLFKHALYLPTPVVLIDCPETSLMREEVAHIINHNLQRNPSEKLVIFRLTLGVQSKTNSPSKSPKSTSSRLINYIQDQNVSRSQDRNSQLFRPNADALEESTNDSGWATSSNSSVGNEITNTSRTSKQDDWTVWNKFRSLLEPDHRIGLCLAIGDNDLENGPERLDRWTGEPVRMIILGVDQFTSATGFRNTMRPVGNIKEFMRTIAIVNSLQTSFVVQARDNVDTQEHLQCLSSFCDMLDLEHPDKLRAWNDTLLSPLQPLSNNLDSSTYRIFENDLAKYCKYHQAMVQAIHELMMKDSSTGRSSFIIMVLGAGRGPLVDAMIKAIKRFNLQYVHFLIYALDKNYSSIKSLRYKKVHEWDKCLPNIRVEVVEADMRVWEPSEKADIIATELLGSFSDNELSPECIDGTWRFATKETICIPQSYSSYLAPILSYKMEQEMHKSRFFAAKTNIRDQLLVVRLSNYYTISEPKELFKFDHQDISKRPVEGGNQREATLRFTSKIDTVCHGFAGYFTANLFGSVSITTVPMYKTATMESWFSAFIPIEKPVQLPANSCLEVKFYRKETFDKVWYEWLLTEPEISRVHSREGNGTAMSKFI